MLHSVVHGSENSLLKCCFALCMQPLRATSLCILAQAENTGETWLFGGSVCIFATLTIWAPNLATDGSGLVCWITQTVDHCEIVP